MHLTCLTVGRSTHLLLQHVGIPCILISFCLQVSSQFRIYYHTALHSSPVFMSLWCCRLGLRRAACQRSLFQRCKAPAACPPLVTPLQGVVSSLWFSKPDPECLQRSQLHSICATAGDCLGELISFLFAQHTLQDLLSVKACCECVLTILGVLLQFVTALSSNIQALTNSSVRVCHGGYSWCKCIICDDGDKCGIPECAKKRLPDIRLCADQQQPSCHLWDCLCSCHC